MTYISTRNGNSQIFFHLSEIMLFLTRSRIQKAIRHASLRYALAEEPTSSSSESDDDSE